MVLHPRPLAARLGQSQPARARWAHKHGKTLIACSDAHSLQSIGRNASTVEADELTMESIFAGIRAGRVTFHRRGLELGPLVYETGKAMSPNPATSDDGSRPNGEAPRATWGLPPEPGEVLPEA